MSEDLVARQARTLGRFGYLSLGSTTLAQLRRSKFVRTKLNVEEERRKPDGVVFLPLGGIKAVIETKQPKELTSRHIPSVITDYPLMARLGEKLRKLELAQKDVRSTREALERAEFAVEVADPYLTLSLDDAAFDLSIGKRVLVSEHSDTGVPVYSANVIVPFGKVAASNLENFDRPSLLWGIDGNFDWNFIPAGHPFATTDHCGRLQVLRDDLLPEYVFWYLKLTRARYGFDRTFRSSLGNMKAEVSVQVPLDSGTGQPSLSRQRAFAEGFKSREASRTLSLRALEDVLSSRISVEAWMSDQPI
ncbi:restriction endonuclease subunit S domain-containing protein [Bradyrhizobium embrapense]